MMKTPSLCSYRAALCGLLLAAAPALSFAQSPSPVPALQALHESQARVLTEMLEGGLMSRLGAWEAENDGLVAELNTIRLLARVNHRATLTAQEEERVKLLVLRVATNMEKQWALMLRLREAGMLPPQEALAFLSGRAHFLMKESAILAPARACSEEALLKETLTELAALLEKA